MLHESGGQVVHSTWVEVRGEGKVEKEREEGGEVGGKGSRSEVEFWVGRGERSSGRRKRVWEIVEERFRSA